MSRYYYEIRIIRQIRQTARDRSFACLLLFFFASCTRNRKRALNFCEHFNAFFSSTYISGAEVRFKMFRVVSLRWYISCTISFPFFKTLLSNMKVKLHEDFYQKKYHSISWKFLFKMNFNHPSPANSDI